MKTLTHVNAHCTSLEVQLVLVYSPKKLFQVSSHYFDNSPILNSLPLHSTLSLLLPNPTPEITLSQNFKSDDSYSLSPKLVIIIIIVIIITFQACDNIAYLWDMRTGGYVQYFEVCSSSSSSMLSSSSLSSLSPPSTSSLPFELSLSL